MLSFLSSLCSLRSINYLNEVPIVVLISKFQSNFSQDHHHWYTKYVNTYMTTLYTSRYESIQQDDQFNIVWNNSNRKRRILLFKCPTIIISVSECKTVQLKNVVVSLIDEDHIDQVINKNFVLILKTAH